MGTGEQGERGEQENRGTGVQGDEGEQGELLFKEVPCYACSQSLPPPPTHDIKFGQKNRPTNRTKGSQKIGQNFAQNFWQKRRTITIGPKFALM